MLGFTCKVLAYIFYGSYHIIQNGWEAVKSLGISNVIMVKQGSFCVCARPMRDDIAV